MSFFCDVLCALSQCVVTNVRSYFIVGCMVVIRESCFSCPWYAHGLSSEPAGWDVTSSV